jgi:hypothetical protein
VSYQGDGGVVWEAFAFALVADFVVVAVDFAVAATWSGFDAVVTDRALR